MLSGLGAKPLIKDFKRLIVRAGGVLAGPNSSITSTSALANMTGLVSINTGQIAGRRNSVINGNGLVQQLSGITVTLTAALQYGVADMHLIGVTSGTGVSGSVGVLSNTGFTCGVGYGAIAASWTTGQFIHKHRMRGNNTKKHNGKTVTISGNIYQDTGGTRNFTISLGKPTTTLDTFSAVTNLSTSSAKAVATATVTPFSFTVTLGSTDASLGLEILITDNAANTVSSKNYAISDLQLEPGSTASTFEQPVYETELRISQTYLPVWKFTATNARGPTGQCFSATDSLIPLPNPVPTRVPITGIVSSGTFQVLNASAAGINATGLAIAGNQTENMTTIDITVAAGLVAGDSTNLIGPTAGSGLIYGTGAQL
jgi:hypothetical protein